MATWTALGFVLCAAVLLVAGWALTRRDGRRREPDERPSVADEMIRKLDLDEDEDEGPRRRDG